jgi:hypothetical protein
LRWLGIPNDVTREAVGSRALGGGTNHFLLEVSSVWKH